MPINTPYRKSSKVKRNFIRRTKSKYFYPKVTIEYSRGNRCKHSVARKRVAYAWNSSYNACIYIKTIKNLKPYDFEPACPPRIEFLSDHDVDEEITDGRNGNTNWCLCGHCQAMGTEAESLCCRDTNDIPDNYFEEKSLNPTRINRLEKVVMMHVFNSK